MRKGNERKILESMPDSFKFHLRDPVAVRFNDESILHDFVEVCAPTLEMYWNIYELKQLIAQAVISSTELMSRIAAFSDDLRSSGTLSRDISKEVEDEKGGDEPESPAQQGEMVKSAILFAAGSQRVKVPYIIALFRDAAALAGCVRVNGVPLNPFQWEQLRPDDQMDMLIQFAGVFMLPWIFSETDEKRKIPEGR